MRGLQKGKVMFSMLGGYPESLLNELFERKIKVGGIRNENGLLFAEADMNSYPFIARRARKYGIRTHIVRKSGIYFALSGLKGRPGIIIGCFSSIILVLVLRLFVWHIDIHGNETLTDSQVLRMLEQHGFTAGVFANDTNALDAERKILMSTDTIKWINIEVNGSRADVYLNESNDDIPDEVDMKTPCNIVAAKTGVIVDTDVISGHLQYEKGSGVAEGSVIVSGTVSSGDSMILVHSDAKVIADYTEDVEFSMNFTTTEKIPYGETFTNRQIMILGMVFPLGAEPVDTVNTVCTEQTEVFSLFGVPLPIKLRTETYTAYKDIMVTRTLKDVERILDGRLEMYQYNFLKDVELLDTKKEYITDENGVTLKCRMTLRGDIGVKKPIYQH